MKNCSYQTDATVCFATNAPSFVSILKNQGLFTSYGPSLRLLSLFCLRRMMKIFRPAPPKKLLFCLETSSLLSMASKQPAWSFLSSSFEDCPFKTACMIRRHTNSDQVNDLITATIANSQSLQFTGYEDSQSSMCSAWPWCPQNALKDALQMRSFKELELPQTNTGEISMR